MSENTTTPSMPKRRKGCSDASQARLGIAAQRQEVDARAQLAVFGQVAARLPHEPDGRPVDGLAARGTREARARTGSSGVRGAHRARIIARRFRGVRVTCGLSAIQKRYGRPDALLIPIRGPASTCSRGAERAASTRSAPRSALAPS